MAVRKAERQARMTGLLQHAMALGMLILATATAVPAQTGAVVDTTDAVSALVAEGRLQEAAWEARDRGEDARADSLLDRLEAILRSPPILARPLGIDSQGVSYTFRLDHGKGVHSIFKVDGSDIFCPECGAGREVAAYRVDRLLGFDLTPMTVFQRIVVDGDTLDGSAMYFVDGASEPAEVGAGKSDRLRLFDAIIGNSDRHDGNWLLHGGRIVAIDHNRAFEYQPATRPKTCWESEVDAIEAPAQLGSPYGRYRELPADSLAAPLFGVLDPDRILNFVRMRDRIVARVEARAEERKRSLPRVDCLWDGSPD